MKVLDFPLKIKPIPHHTDEKFEEIEQSVKKKLTIDEIIQEIMDSQLKIKYYLDEIEFYKK